MAIASAQPQYGKLQHLMPGHRGNRLLKKIIVLWFFTNEWLFKLEKTGDFPTSTADYPEMGFFEEAPQNYSERFR